jgi:hypothetical protein
MLDMREEDSLLTMDFESLSVDDLCQHDSQGIFLIYLMRLTVEIIPNCATCPSFSFCEDSTKMGGTQYSKSMPSIVIKYETDVESVPKSIKIKTRNSKPSTLPLSAMLSINDHPFESWRDMNTHRYPVYGSKRQNLFLQLQAQSMLGGEPAEDEEEEIDSQILPFYLSLPPPDDLPVDGNLAYFLSIRMDTFLGFDGCFSSAYKNMYLLSVNNRVLRHVLFAFVKFLNTQDRNVQSAICNMHLQKAIPQLQHALTFLNFDVGHILSVPLLAYLAFWSRNFNVAKQHLRGFYKMLLHTQFLEQDKYGRVSVSSRMPSLVLLMWRVALRLDHSFDFMRPEEETIPLIKSRPEISRRCISESIDPAAAHWADCLVLTDELEDLRNVVVHYNNRATAVRRSPDYTPVEARQFIDQAKQKAIQKIERLEGKILAVATAYNTIYQPVFLPISYSIPEPFPAKEFPHYSSLFKTLHHRFIDTIIVNRALLIHTTITAHPQAGPYPMERLRAAIEICCGFAVLKERMPFVLQARGRLLEALMFAGYTFCSPKYILGSGLAKLI